MQKSNRIVKTIAEERMERLLELAQERTIRGRDGSDRLAKRYIGIAKKISAHYKIPMSKGMKNSICKKCSSVLIPGLTCTVRVASSKSYLVYKCGGCGEEKHIFYK